MTGSPVRWLPPLFVAALLAAGAMWAKAQQGGNERPAAANAANPQFAYFGSSNCQRCHFNPIQQDFDEGRTFFVGMNESQIWSLHDRHSKAYKLLECERGQAMGRRLGWNVLQDQRCLSCHADWQAHRPNPGEMILAEGVACEACHGPSSKYINDHSNPKWRQLPFQVRSADYGMLMVRDPQVRAKVCLSCHVGNVEQGKVITHEMYAAGHPPLPSFELQHFGDAMRHWSDVPDQLARIQRDRPARADQLRKDLTFIQEQLGENSGTVPALKTALYGAVMTLRESAKLLSDQAGAAKGAGAAANESLVWPEFALYDCAMCHHDLRYPAWRQTRLTGAPGRPQIPRWPQALVGVAIEQAAGGDRAAAGKTKQEFTKLLTDLDAPFLQQPFGDRATIADPAIRLRGFLDGLLEQMKPLKHDRDAATQALRQLCTAATEKVPDYDSARQLAWAFESIYRGLNSAGGPTNDAIDRELAALRTELRLTLNPLRSDAKDVCSQALSDADLQAAMNSAAAYSPEQFQRHFRTLNEALAK